MTSDPVSILVVDDRPANRYLVAHSLSRTGYKVVEASTGKEALERASDLPTVIVLDVKLPDILGYEVCRRIKSNPSTSHIPILQLSAAFLSNESKVTALESGADSFLTQPVEPNVLIATVKSLVRLHDAESQARQLGQQWQATFDALNEGVALVDSSGNVQRCNRAMTEILGRTYSETEGQSITTLLHDVFGFETEGKVLSTVHEVEHESRYFRCSITPVVLQEVSSGSIFILSEITEQKRAHAALLVNERLAATGRMANIIAHEINNPLAAITNLLYLLESTIEQSNKASEFVETAQQELSRVSRITRQILSFNRESISPISLDVSELLEDVLALHNREIIKGEIQIVKEWRGDLRIHGFPAQLRQVFSNLLRNAIEASYPAGEIRLRTSLISRWREGGPAVRVSIGDHGVGISPENLGRIFEAFYTTKELKGSGIGLWLSSSIVHEHHGDLLVKSRNRLPHSGTCISVMLPTNQEKL